MKIKYTFFVIFLFMKFGFSQNENHKGDNFEFIIKINAGDPISGILKYNLEHQQLSLTFHTIKMKKKFLKRGFKQIKRIKSSKKINPTTELKKSLLKESLWVLCQDEKDMSGMQSDGIYFHIQINKIDKNGKNKCSVLVDRDITSKKDNDVGKMLNKILYEIQYYKLEEEFKNSLEKGYYFNYGSFLWKKA